mgnify:CR=1 FL=1
MSDHRYAERTGELRGGVPQPPDYELLVAPNPGVATWATPAAEQSGAGQAGLHYGGAWDQPGTTGSAGFAGTTAAGEQAAVCVVQPNRVSSTWPCCHEYPQVGLRDTVAGRTPS